MISNSKINFKIKDKLFAHLETSRPYTVIWCGLVSLTGSFLIFEQFPPLKISILVFIIPIMGWTAGLYLSDFLDRKLDAIEKPHRPIPSGRIKPNEALIIGGLFAILGGILSLYLSVNNFLLVFIVAFLVFGYSKFSKSKGIIGNINRGLVTVIAFIFGVFSKDQFILTIPIYIWLLAFVFIFHDINSNLIGAIRDVHGDKKGDYITIPVKYGIKKSVYISLILTIIWLSLLLILPYYYKFLKQEFYYLMIIDIIILISFYMYLFNTIKNYTREKALKLHEFFIVERITLASAIIFGVVDFFIALVIYIAALFITIIAQFTLRKRYEFEEIIR